MKQAYVASLCFACLGIGFQARCATLPAACGNDKLKFDVTLHKGQPAPAPPVAGKARIVFIENDNGWHNTVRFGMDGAWVGADAANSYFTLDVAPGMYHLCASWQGRKRFDLAPLTAEAGKVYYFAAEVTDSKYYDHFGLSQLNDDQGKYRVKAWKLSTSKPAPKDED